jgi:hypothetical protein
MAEVVAMRNNCLGFPVYGCPWCITFPMLDGTGKPTTGLTCDSEISKNGDTSVDCTNEGIEIPATTATNAGQYYLLLTGAEMTAECVVVNVYSGVAADPATVITLYPKKTPKVIAGGTCGATGNDTTHVHLPAAPAIDDIINGMLIYTLTNTGALQARIIMDYVGSTHLATLGVAWTAVDNTTTYDLYMTDVAVASILPIYNLFVPAVAAGAASGLPINGANAYTPKDVYDILASGTYGNAALNTKLNPISCLDAAITTRQATAASISNLDAAVSSRMAANANISNLDAAITSRMASSALISNLDAAVSSRQATISNASLISNLDAAVSSRQVSSSLISNLDAAVSSRQATISNASLISNLDAAITSRGDNTTLQSINTQENTIGLVVARLEAALAKVPQSDGTVTHNDTALAAIKTKIETTTVLSKTLTAQTITPADTTATTTAQATIAKLDNTLESF